MYHYTIDEIEALLRRIGFTTKDESFGKHQVFALELNGKTETESLRGMLNGTTDDCTDWRIAIDNAGCYDKPSKCPILIKLNQCVFMDTAEFERRLRSACTRLANDQGYNESNSFKYDRFRLENQ